MLLIAVAMLTLWRPRVMTRVLRIVMAGALVTKGAGCWVPHGHTATLAKIGYGKSKSAISRHRATIYQGYIMGGRCRISGGRMSGGRVVGG